MSFNIPGYFLDQKTKKLFKIQPHGPFSLRELEKRVREEEAAALAESQLNEQSNKNRSCSKPRIPTNMIQFLRQRATLKNSSTTQLDVSHPFLVSRLKYRRGVPLEGPAQNYNNMLVAVTRSPELGEIVLSHRPSELRRYGYATNPEFQLWHCLDHWHHIHGEILSLQFGYSYSTMMSDHHTLVGTSNGSVWRYTIQDFPELSNEDLSSYFLESDGSIRDDGRIIGGVPTAYWRTDPYIMSAHKVPKDLFFASDVHDEQDRIMVGGDQALYLYSSEINLISSRKVKSSIFSAHLPKNQPHLGWTGARNGTIQLTDFRQCNQKNLSMIPTFKQSSSVTNIQQLSQHEILTTGMDGSVQIWDTRQPKQKEHNEPIRKLKGHVNESTRNLGFDVDLQSNLLMLSGSDGRVRIWSMFDSNSNEPIWCSDKFTRPVPAAKFVLNQSQAPRMHESWTTVIDEQILLKQCPGIMLFGVNSENNNTSSIQWFTSVK